MTPRTASIVLRVVGGIAVTCAVLGVLYNAASLFGVLTGAIDGVGKEFSAPYIKQAFFVMSTCYVAFYVVLMWCGVRFLQLSTSLWTLFTTLLVAEVVVHLAIGALWANPTHGMSIAAASGISGGGVMPQFFILFPLWAPVATWFASRSLRG